MVETTIPQKTGIAGGVCAAAMAICLPFTAQNEGLRLKAYLDPAHIWTICDGETLDVQPGETKTPEQCQSMLATRLGYFDWQVQMSVKVPMKPPMEAAFSDFSYNCGIAAFQHSTILKKLNSGDSIGACEGLLSWTRAKGVVLPGLVKRRAAEYKLCMEGI